jgi:tetratricopeptide (TPR) repeat protein
MKITGTFLLRFFPFAGIFLGLNFFSISSFAQELIVANNEPTILYKKANESLSLGNTRLAINIFEKVIAFYESEGRVKELSESYLGMALSFAFNGHYEESIRYHKKALRAHRRYRSNESDLTRL